MKVIPLLLLLLLLCHLNAEWLSGIDPAYYDYNPRLMAMGGAGIALAAYSPSAALANPAALANTMQHYTFECSNSTYFQLLSYNYLGTALKLNNSFILSAGLDFCGDDVMSEYEMTLTWSANAGRLFPQYEFLQKLALGANLKLLGSSFGNNSSGSYVDNNGLEHQVKGNSFGYALDWGVQYQLNEKNRLGIFNRNLLNDIFWNSSNETGTALGSYSESRPVALIVGYAYQSSNTALSLDYNKTLYSDGRDCFRNGLEIKLLSDALALRCGYSTQLFSLENNQFNIGCGIKFKYASRTFRLDIAYRFFTPWEGHNNLLLGLTI
ncbi:MAG: hypothetical protein K9N06_03375 [Candidatus Cloacimonetes bacterium]|nr:hypothetical protein [Candidatus Cloacimonadota bacterium]